MVKKGLLVLVLAAFVAGGAFAQMSIGLGGNFSNNFNSYKTVTAVGGTESITGGQNVKGGLFAFLDATLLEVDIGLQFWDGDGIYADKRSTSYFTLGLYGKYPVQFNGFSLFPMFGIQLDYGMSSKTNGDDTYINSSDKAKDMADAMNLFWIKLGVGADLNLSKQMYIRSSFLYGINFGTENTKKAKENSYYSTYDTFHDGIDFRVAAGFRL